MELVMIFVVALLVFGPKRVPELARTLGRGLSEFRRASNDLRQSLALDELQHDLRKDLTKDLGEKQTIHKPGDRPAQAGDGIATPKPAAAGNSEVGGVANLSNHPGELPLGNDHEHRDVADDSADSAMSDADTDGSRNSNTNTNQAADSELGNVPVSDSKPTDPQRG